MIHLVLLAWKNVFRQKKRSFTLGVNYGVVAFILVLLMSFARGATENISTNLLRATAGHITITGQFASGGKIYSGLRRVDGIVAEVGKVFGKGTRVVSRYSLQSMVYFNGLSKRLAFTGIDTEQEGDLRGQSVFSAGSWEAFAADPSAVAVPASAAEYFGLSLGDELVLSTRTRFGAFNTAILVVRGIYSTDNFFARDLVLAHFEAMRKLDLAVPDSATTIYVYFPAARALAQRRDALASALAASGFEVDVPKTDSEAIAAVSGASPKYEVDPEGRDRVMVKLATLEEVLGLVRTILAAVNAVGALIATVMLFVIAVSIFINLRMTINERLREIGTLRAIGAGASTVSGLFVLESVAVAALFSGLGTVLAAVAAVVISHGPVFPAGGQLALFLDAGHLVLIPGVEAILGTVAAVCLFAAVFSFFPARRGGAVSPAEALARTF